jgi:hypothetical protein
MRKAKSFWQPITTNPMTTPPHAQPLAGAPGPSPRDRGHPQLDRIPLRPGATHYKRAPLSCKLRLLC